MGLGGSSPFWVGPRDFSPLGCGLVAPSFCGGVVYMLPPLWVWSNAKYCPFVGVAWVGVVSEWAWLNLAPPCGCQ